MNISQFGKGAVKSPIDIRDYRFEVAVGAIPLPTEFSLRDKIGAIKNQNGSLSCVAQAFAYYAEVLDYIETGEKEQLSARDIYSKVFLPQGGSYLKNCAKKILNSGVVIEADAPSYENGNPPSEVFMRKRDDITSIEEEGGMSHWTKSYLTWNNNNYETFKQAIYQGTGSVIAAWGNNHCWSNSILEVPDVQAQCDWAHGVYCTGWKVINGIEHLEFVNSWGKEWGDQGFGFMPKSYIEKGYVFNPVTMVDLPNGTYSQLQSQVFKLKEQIVLLIEAIKKKFGLK